MLNLKMKILKSKKWIIILAIGLLIITSFVMGIIINQNTKSSVYLQYLKNKYSLKNGDIRLLSYKKEHTVGNDGWFESTKRTAPKIITYKVKGRTVKVVDNGKIISDDYQMEDFSYIASEYFSTLLGYDVEFVEFIGISKYGNGYCDAISNYVQKNNNYFVSSKNIEKFLIDYNNYTPDNRYHFSFTSLNLYINIKNYNNINALIKDIDKKLAPFIKKNNYNNIKIWLHSNNGEKLKIIKSTLRNDNLSPEDFCTYYVENLKNIKAYLMLGEEDLNFKRIGNFNVDDRGIWFFAR